MAKTNRILFWILIAFLLVSCAQKTPAKPAVQETAQKGEVTNPVSRSAWEVEWEKTTGAAKKEGKVMLYSSAGAEIKNALVPAFKQKFGIELEVVMGRSAEVAEKLMSERRAGLYLADVFVAGVATLMIYAKPGGALDPLEPALILPEVTNPKTWYSGDILWVDKQHTVLIFLAGVNTDLVINTSIVKPEEIRSFKDLLNPKWKGKFVMDDPTLAGPGASTFNVVGEIIMGWDFWRDFVRQEPVVIRNARLQAEWVSQGKYPIGISPWSNMVTEFKAAGAPLSYIVPVEGTQLNYGVGSLSLINRAAHPNAAKVFINWLLAKEGQTIYSRAYGIPSARLDVPTQGFEAEKIIKPGMKIFLGAIKEEWALKDAERMKLAKEIFGPVIK